MNSIYLFLLTFILIFFSELGDKTQLLVLSFSTKGKSSLVLLGVAIGTFFSHGLAIIFGSKLSSFQSEIFHFYISLFTYFSFLLFGILGFLSSNKEEKKALHSTSKFSFIKNFSHFQSHYIFMIALSIIIGEFGDKTFLSSLGLSLQYPSHKFPLILGSITGMVVSNLIAIFFGRFLEHKLRPSVMQNLSNILFLLFGIIGLFSIFF